LKHQRFFTGLVCPGHEPREFESLSANGWKVTFENSSKRNRGVVGDEIVISTSSWQMAQKVLDLIVGCSLLVHGDPPFFSTRLIAWNEQVPELAGIFRNIKEACFSTTQFPRACTLAARASRSSRFIYAIAKYQQSMSLYSVSSMDLAPSEVENLKLSSIPNDHVMFGYALIAAYSVLEDLGVELRATREQPSRLNGEWNPVVRQNLEKRLVRNHVNLNEPILWMIRGTSTRIERKMGFAKPKRATWAGGLVRDGEINVADAIARASFLRSKVASHKTEKLLSSLSPYDVVNVQDLARRLVLDALNDKNRLHATVERDETA
jgi:hypothetical protein